MIIDIFSVDTLWEPLAPSRVVILFRLLFHKWDNMPFFINFPLNTFVLETLCCMYLRIDETGPSISEDLLSIHYEKVEKKNNLFFVSEYCSVEDILVKPLLNPTRTTLELISVAIRAEQRPKSTRYC